MLFPFYSPVTELFSEFTYSGNSLDVSTEDANLQDLFVNTDDGGELYHLGDTNDTVYQYTLSSSWDASTGSYASKSLDCSSEDTSLRGLCMGNSGTRLYVAGLDNDAVFQYNLTGGWDVSTGSYASKSLDVSGETTSANGIVASSDGTKMYVLGSTERTVYQYTISTPWEMDTGSYASKSLDVSSQVSAGGGFGLAISSDNSKLYVLDNNDGEVHEYTLSTPGDLSTGSSTGVSIDLSSEDSNHKGIVMGNNNTIIYSCGDQNNRHYQYD